MKRTHRRKVSRGIYRKIGLLFLIACFFAVCAPLSYIEANQKKNVLVLHSYHKGLGWTDRITQGIESVLHNTDQDIELHVEYMDTKRIFEAQYLQHLYELYRHKFRNRRFDLIVSSDDHAFNFLLAHHQELFPDTPVVFCGVNDFKDSMLVGHNLITGVVESFDIKGTIDVALQLHPNTKEVFVIVDKTLSGAIVKELMMQDIPHFKDVISFTFLEDIDMSEVLERVENLSRDSIVFLISLLTDRSGNTFSFEKSCALISEYSAVPIYSHSDVYLGHGIVGGMLNCGDDQGQMAGEMASRILHGEKVKDIPVVKKSHNLYKFDYQQMQRFGIKLSSLPESSTVINRPYSFYSEHKGLILSVFAGIAGLVLIILILSINIINRKQAEKVLCKREQELNIRNQISRVFLTISDNEMYAEVLQVILEAMQSPYGTFAYINEDGDRIVPSMARDIWDECKIPGKSIFFPRKEWGDTIWAGCLIEKRAILSNGPFKADGHIPVIRSLAVPIIHQGKAIGNFVVGNKETDYNQKDQKMLEIIASYTAPILNARLQRDIQEKLHKKAEEALRDSQKFSSNLLNNSPHPILLINPDTSLRYVNPALETLTGFSSEEIIGRKAPYPWWTEETMQKTGEDLKKAMRKGAQKIEEFFQKKNGERFWVEITSVPIRENGEFKYYLANWVETTESKYAEEALQESEAEKQAILDASIDMILHLDIEMRIIWANKEAWKGVGLNGPEELIGRKCHEVYMKTEEPCPGCPCKKSMETGRIEHSTYRLEGVVGIGDSWWENFGMPVKDESGRIIGTIEIARNITERKRTEEEKERMQVLLLQAQKMESLGTLVSGVAHEINNPINTIMINTPLLQKIWRDFHSILKEHADKDPGRKYGGLTYDFLRENLDQLISDMDIAANHVAAIIKGLKDFSRKVSVTDRKSIQINTAIKNAVRLFQTTLRKSGIDLELDLPHDLPFMQGNLQNLEQIILNLTINAAQAIDHGHGKVKIKTGFKKRDEQIFISVSDNGRGIDPAISNKIFDPFFTDKQAEGGTGLGLSVTYNLVKAHDGEITFQSEKGIGTTFTVFFPTTLRKKPVKILIVDDDEMIRKVLGEALTRDRACVVEDASNGIEALIKLGTHHPDLLILDMFMPEMDGLQVCRALREEPELSNMRVIILTGYPNDPKIEQVAEMGFTNIYAKPLKLKEFVKAVNKVLETEIEELGD